MARRVSRCARECGCVGNERPDKPDELCLGPGFRDCKSCTVARQQETVQGLQDAGSLISRVEAYERQRQARLDQKRAEVELAKLEQCRFVPLTRHLKQPVSEVQELASAQPAAAFPKSAVNSGTDSCGLQNVVPVKGLQQYYERLVRT